MHKPETTIVLVPLRSFDDAKSRLRSVLSPSHRHTLMKQMATTVVAAARDLPVWVVTDDTEVKEWAESVGATPFSVGAPGLNPAVSISVDAAAEAGAERVIVAHADLPEARDLRIVGGAGVAIAPDQARDGTNVMSLPTRSGFVFAYGPGSFVAHRAEAARIGLDFDEIVEPSLAWDVDDPDDLPPIWRAVSCE